MKQPNKESWGVPHLRGKLVNNRDKYLKTKQQQKQKKKQSTETDPKDHVCPQEKGFL